MSRAADAGVPVRLGAARRWVGERPTKVDNRNSNVGRDDALPSVETTQKFLTLCEQYGSHHAAVAAVARGRRGGVAGLPVRDDWQAWNAAEMRAAVEYLHAAGYCGDRIRLTPTLIVWTPSDGRLAPLNQVVNGR